MPQKSLEALEAQITTKLKRNTLLTGVCALAGFSLLFPAFSVEGSKFDYQEFCFRPPSIPPSVYNYCSGKHRKRGIAWRVALERAENADFKGKVTMLGRIPAQNPNAGLYGLCGALFFGGAFCFFKSGTEELEKNLDVVVANKKILVTERSLDVEKHISIQKTKAQQEEEFVKDLLNREHGEALYSLMSDAERELAAARHAKGEKLDESAFDLQIAELKAKTAEQLEKELKHKLEMEKLAKGKKGKSDSHSASGGNEAAKAELEEKLKEHEDGWLHTLCTTRKILIIEGEQGSFKSYTAALIAYCRYQLKGHKLGWIVDTDYHQNKSKAWSILQPLEFEAYGSNKNGESLREGLERFLEGIEIRDEDNFAVETLIFDELTTYGDYPECEGIAKSFMKFALSAPRKAAYGLIAITHSMTNEGMGAGKGMAKARERGTLHLLLNADNDYNPTFKGTLNGFKNDQGELMEDKAVTLPDWFRPGTIAKMFEEAGK